MEKEIPLHWAIFSGLAAYVHSPCFTALLLLLLLLKQVTAVYSVVACGLLYCRYLQDALGIK